MTEPRPLDCAAAREQLSARGDGETQTAAALATLAEHVDGCAACRDFAARCAGLARAFDPLRTAEPPADLEARLLARAPAAAPVVLRGGAGWRVAAGLAGLLGVGAIGAWAEARRGGAAPEAGTNCASWAEPLAGRALHPGDASLKTWTGAVAKAMGEERR